LQPAWSVTGAALGGQASGATSCLNGSLAYFPALVVLALLAWRLRSRRHKAANSLWLAVVLLTVSLFFHTIDHLVCSLTLLGDYQFGTHFLSHLLNAIALFILLRASMLHQEKPLVHEILPPEAKWSKGL